MALRVSLVIAAVLLLAIGCQAHEGHAHSPSPAESPNAILEQGQLEATFSQLPTFSKIWGLLQSTGLDKYITETGNITLLAPSDDAFAAATSSINVATSLLAESARQAWIINLLKAHTIGSFLDYDLLSTHSAGSSFKTLLGTSVFLTTEQSINYFYVNGSNPAKNASGFAPNLQQPGDISVSIQGIDSVLFPVNASRLLTNITIAPSPAAAPAPVYALAPGPSAATELSLLNDTFSQLPTFSQIVALLNQTGFQYYLVNTPNTTVLAPSNDAFNAAEETFKIIDSLITDVAVAAEFATNILKAHTIPLFLDYDALSTYSAGSSFKTLLNTSIFVDTEQSINYFYVNSSNRADNASGFAPNLQQPGDISLSIQGIDKILFPINVSRLIPPNFLPVGSTPPAAAPAPTPVSSPSTSSPSGSSPSTSSPSSPSSPSPSPPKSAGTRALGIASLVLASLSALLLL